MGIHARDVQKRNRLLELLPDKAQPIRAIANEVGLSRSYLYRLRERDPAVAAAWDEREGRATSPAAEGDPGEGDAGEHLEVRLRKLGLAVLAQIAKDENNEAKDRVSAARALVQATSLRARPPKAAPVTPALRVLPRSEPPPVTADQVAELLRVKNRV